MQAQAQQIPDLIAAHATGQSLAQGFYTRPDLFTRDMDLLLNRWTCAGHTSELPNKGDYLTAELGNESAIVIRGQDSEIRALANVCRHRGSRICVTRRGHANILTCPYHAWTYNLDGTLRRAGQMPEGFDPAQHSLLPLPLKIIGGLIFISFADAPPSLENAAPALETMTTRFAWDKAKIAERKTYTVKSNWKLVLENYHECYHCGPAHPEFSELHMLARPGVRFINEDDIEAWESTADGQEVYRVMRSHMSENASTGSRNGKPVAPLMGSAHYNDPCVFGELGFLSAFLAYPDYGVIYRFIPRGVLETEMEVLWLVNETAQPGRDYDPETLTWLWDITSQADKKIIERNQAGVLSRAYRPGPFSLMEPGTRQYVERYVAELATLK
jgi:Rieske 2Fe-2S family protein